MPTDFGHRFDRDLALLTFDGASIGIARGREIAVQSSPTLPIETLQTYLVGAALGVAVVQRGRLVLHASAVRFGSSVTLFCGDAGAGKSTLAGALVASGGELVGDDVLPVSVDPGEIRVGPGLPLVKLWPDSASLLGLDPTEIPILDPLTGKLRYDLHASHVDHPVGLNAVVVLRDGESRELERLSESSAMLSLIANTYAASALHAGGLSARHFADVTALASRVPSWVLTVDRSDSIWDTTARVMSELAS
jgi:hypothetical protein